MFLIRQAKPDDAAALLKLARTVHFNNLPPVKEIIDAKIGWSRQSFRQAAMGEPHDDTPGDRPSRHSTGLKNLTGRSPLFMFVLEQLEENAGVVGTSQVISRMGGPGSPNLSLALSRANLFSQSLQRGVTHIIAQLHKDETGPSELGGLILQHSLRGHRLKLGRLLSLVRFHFAGLHRELFARRMIAEMMGPVTPEGYNPFWEHCTRRFINLPYDEAIAFSQESKEFILSLLPPDPIYLTLLSPEACNAAGQVGPETEPALAMLKKLGFEEHDHIDPFDGGPHLQATTSEIAMVKGTRRARLGTPASDSATLKGFGLVSTLCDQGEFRAVQTPMQTDRAGKIVIPRRVMSVLGAVPGSHCGYTPIADPVRVVTAPPTRVNGVHPARKPAKSRR